MTELNANYETLGLIDFKTAQELNINLDLSELPFTSQTKFPVMCIKRRQKFLWVEISDLSKNDLHQNKFVLHDILFNIYNTNEQLEKQCSNYKKELTIQNKDILKFITCGSVEHFNRLVEQYGEKKALEIWKFSEENLSLLKENIFNINNETCNFEQGGSFSLASTAGELKELNASAQLMKKLKISLAKNLIKVLILMKLLQVELQYKAEF